MSLAHIRSILPAFIAIAAPLCGQGTWRPLPELKNRSGHAMAYDPVRERVVLFGGITGVRAAVALMPLEADAVLTDDTWEWDGRRWHQPRPKTSPSPRRAAMMAWDPVGRRMLLFGGGSGGGPDGGPCLDDTWSWDGQEWTKLTPRTSPPPRAAPGMATDWVRGRITLFGGLAAFGGLYASVLSDTWEWDGTDWQQVFPTTVPLNRMGPGTAFSWRTRRIVMFGGSRGALAATDQYTWEWDGRTWLQHDPPVRPPVRSGAMVEEPGGGRRVLFETENSMQVKEDWLWDGSSWTLIPASSPRPSPSSIALATDHARGEIVCFAGYDDRYQAYSIVAQTWVFDGKAWRQVADWEGPQGSYAMVHDSARDQYLFIGTNPLLPEQWALRGDIWQKLPPPPARMPPSTMALLVDHTGLGKVVRHGGESPTGRLNDTWLWDGKGWQDVTGTIRPILDAVAYDSRRARVVGVAERGAAQRTWEWDPVNGWMHRESVHKPPTNVYYPKLAYDPVRGRTVLFGGGTSVGAKDEVWEWDGVDWQHVDVRPRPPGREYHNLVYVPALGGVVTFGGVDWATKAFYQDMWLWDGKRWMQLQTSSPPSSFRYSMMPPRFAGYDPGRQRIIASYADFWVPGRGTHWEYLFETLQTDRAHPSAGQGLQLSVTLPSEAGRWSIYALAASSWPGIPLRVVPNVGTEMLPLAPDWLLWATLGQLYRQLDGQGKASLPIVIPSERGLIGVQLHAAAFTLAAQGRVGAITNGIRLTIGP